MYIPIRTYISLYQYSSILQTFSCWENKKERIPWFCNHEMYCLPLGEDRIVPKVLNQTNYAQKSSRYIYPVRKLCMIIPKNYIIVYPKWNFLPIFAFLLKGGFSYCNPNIRYTMVLYVLGFGCLVVLLSPAQAARPWLIVNAPKLSKVASMPVSSEQIVPFNVERHWRQLNRAAGSKRCSKNKDKRWLIWHPVK